MPFLNNNSNVLVTGSTGYIGENLVLRLLKSGVKVTGLSMEDSLLVHPNYTHLKKRLKSFLDIDFYDVIFHLAGTGYKNQTDVDDEIRKYNLESTLSLLKSIKSPDSCVFVFSSSCSVYGLRSNSDLKETDLIEPNNLYSNSKLDAEQAILAFSSKNKMRSVIARIFNVYGNGEKKSIVSKMFNSIQENKPMPFNPNLVRDFIHVEDVCSGLISLVNDSKGIYNLGSGSATKLSFLKDLMEQKLGREMLTTPYKGEGVLASVANIEKISKIGWLPKISINEGLSYIT